MGVEILMPALSPTMTEGKLARWLKKEGDAVRSGDVIAEIETDKATREVEAVDEGVITRILVPEGTENVAVNSVLAELDGGKGAAIAAPVVAAPAVVAAVAAPVVQVAPAAASVAEEKEWGPTRSMTVREALRDAMALEMRSVRVCWRSSGPSGCWICPSPSMALPAWRWVRPSPGCGRLSSS